MFLQGGLRGWGEEELVGLNFNVFFYLNYYILSKEEETI